MVHDVKEYAEPPSARFLAKVQPALLLNAHRFWWLDGMLVAVRVGRFASIVLQRVKENVSRTPDKEEIVEVLKFVSTLVYVCANCFQHWFRPTPLPLRVAPGDDSLPGVLHVASGKSSVAFLSPLRLCDLDKDITGVTASSR